MKPTITTRQLEIRERQIEIRERAKNIERLLAWKAGGDDKGAKLWRAIEIGGLLVEVRDRLEPDQWVPWLKAKWPFNPGTAPKYMRLFKERDRLKSANIDNLSDAYALLSGTDRLRKARRLGERLVNQTQPNGNLAVKELSYPICENCSQSKVLPAEMSAAKYFVHRFSHESRKGKWAFWCAVCRGGHDENDHYTIKIESFLGEPAKVTERLAELRQQHWMDLGDFVAMLVRFLNAIYGQRHSPSERRAASHDAKTSELQHGDRS